jgi:hypothetical protein
VRNPLPAKKFDRRLHLAPVGFLDEIDRGADVSAGFDQPQHLLRLKADLSIDEQQMGCDRLVQEL